MKINIYYGGRGLVEDPTIVVLDKMQAVLEELNVSVERFNLYEMKNALTTLCLLYTSPSPRDRTRSRMPSSA